MARAPCDPDDEEVPGDVRLRPNERLQPSAVTVVRVENGWLVTVFLVDGRKMRHVASSPEDAGRTVRGQLARVDFDWIPALE